MKTWQKRIILVSPFFHPELISTGKANGHLAEAFVAAGHGVTVVCSHPLYPEWRPVRSEAGLAGLKIVRGGAWMRYPKSMPLRRLLLEGWFALYAPHHLWRMRHKADVVVSILPPSLFSLFLDRLLPRDVRRVAVIHDLQGVLAAQEKSALRRGIARLVHAVESRAFRAQDLCIFFSGDMARAAQRSYGLDPARVAVQYPCVTLPYGERVNGEPANRLVDLFPASRLHVVYSGALGYKQNSRQLVALMQAATERYPDIQAHVLSGGPFFEELHAQYGSRPGPRVQFHPLVAERDLGELYARSAIQIIPQAEGTEAAALPSKLPNLLAAGVHLLAICGQESEVGRLIRLAGIGTTVERWEEELFLARLGEAIQSVRRESAAERRMRVQPLLEQFSVAHMVRLALAEEEWPEAAAEMEPERVTVESGIPG